jgi:uncharacterized protein
MDRLGDCFSNGDGVMKDAVKAEQLYRRAADAGHAGAMFSLGLRCNTGDALDKDASNAVE